MNSVFFVEEMDGNGRQEMDVEDMDISNADGQPLDLSSESENSILAAEVVSKNEHLSNERRPNIADITPLFEKVDQLITAKKFYAKPKTEAR